MLHNLVRARNNYTNLTSQKDKLNKRASKHMMVRNCIYLVYTLILSSTIKFKEKNREMDFWKKWTIDYIVLRIEDHIPELHRLGLVSVHGMGTHLDQRLLLWSPSPNMTLQSFHPPSLQLPEAKSFIGSEITLLHQN